MRWGWSGAGEDELCAEDAAGEEGDPNLPGFGDPPSPRGGDGAGSLSSCCDAAALLEARGRSAEPALRWVSAWAGVDGLSLRMSWVRTKASDSASGLTKSVRAVLMRCMHDWARLKSGDSSRSASWFSVS